MENVMEMIFQEREGMGLLLSLKFPLHVSYYFEIFRLFLACVF